MVDPIERDFEVGADLLDPDKVTDVVTAIVEVVEAPQWKLIEYTYKDADDREAKGEPRTFEVAELRWVIEQRFPEFKDTQQRTWRFRASRAQTEALQEGRQPTMNPRSVLGELTSDCNSVGLPYPHSPEMQGKVLVTKSRMEENDTGYQTARHNVVTLLGDRSNFDLDQGIEIVESSEVASKQAASSDY